MKPKCCERQRVSLLSESRFNSVPATVMVPVVGRSRPAHRFNSVDLPDPDGPITATNSPFGMSRFVFDRTGT